MRPIVSAVLCATIVFVSTSVVAVVAAAQLSDWRAAPYNAALGPANSTMPTAATPVSTTRTELTIPRQDGDAEAILVEPRGGSDVGIVLIAGAGGADHQLLLPLAQRFAAAGIAALTYDKRTNGYSLIHRDYEQLADDALAAVAVMRDATGIERIGGWGISEGAWVLSSAAARESSPLTFAVYVSAPVVTPLEQSGWIIDRTLRAAPEFVRRTGATMIAQGRSLFDYLDFDARPLVASIRVPVMAIWGAEDAIVPVNEAYRRMDADLDGALRACILPGLGHDLDANAAAWLPTATAWMKEPSGDELSGTNPAAALGVARPVSATWFVDSRLHLALSTTVAAIAGVLGWRRSTRRRSRSTTQETTYE